MNHELVVLESLATSIRAGLRPTEALGMLRERGLSARLKSALARAERGVANGDPLSDGLAPILTESELALLRAGEEAGTVETCLENIAEERRSRLEDRRAFFRQIAYPALVFHFGALVFALVATMSGGSPVGAIVLWLLPAWTITAGIVWAFRRMEKDPAISAAVLATPLLGSVVRGSSILGFLSSLRLTYTAGLPLPKAAESALGAAENLAVRDNIRKAIHDVWQGGQITPGLAGLKGLPRALGQLLVTGEKTGTLAESLEKVLAVLRESRNIDRARLVRLTSSLIYGIVFLQVAWKVIQFWTEYYSRVL